MTFGVVAPGDVSDYDDAAKAEISASVANTLNGVSADDVVVTVAAASVVITVTILVPAAITAESLSNEVATQLQTTSAASNFISNAAATPITVESVQTIPPTTPVASTGLSTGAIVGIAVGSAAAVLLFSDLVYALRKSGSSKNKSQIAESKMTQKSDTATTSSTNKEAKTKRETLRHEDV